MTFKNNLIVHSSTCKQTFTEGPGSAPKIDRLYVFGQYGYGPKLPYQHKLQQTGQPVRYLNLTDELHIAVRMETGTIRFIRNVDFNPVSTEADPTATHQMELAKIRERIKIIISGITPAKALPDKSITLNNNRRPRKGKSVQ